MAAIVHGITIVSEDGRRVPAAEVVRAFYTRAGLLPYHRQHEVLADVLAAYAGAWGDVIASVVNPVRRTEQLLAEAEREP